MVEITTHTHTHTQPAAAINLAPQPAFVIPQLEGVCASREWVGLPAMIVPQAIST